MFEMKEMEEVVIGLGSNMGDRMTNIKRAISELENRFSTSSKCSPIYESEAWGFDSNDSFLNCCLVLKTKLSPEKVLAETQDVESKLGRVKKSKNNCYESRVIDIDILYYGNHVLNDENLIIPHPLIYDRRFVIEPLAMVCPEWVDPVKKRTVSQLLESCNDKNRVLLYSK